MNLDRNTFVDVDSYIKYISKNFDHRYLSNILEVSSLQTTLSIDDIRQLRDKDGRQSYL